MDQSYIIHTNKRIEANQERGRQQRSYSTPRKNVDQLFESRYFRYSRLPQIPPQEFHTFFADKPLQRYTQDINRFKPVSFSNPEDILNKKYVIVEEKVTYGKPLTPQQFQKLSIKKPQHEFIVYGQGGKQQKISKGIRETLTIEKQTKSHTFCGCCGGCGCCGFNDNKKNEVLFHE